MPRVLLLILFFAFTVYCLVDCLQTPQTEQRNLPKAAWVVLIVVLPVAAPLAWLVFGRPAPSGPPTGMLRPRPQGPQGPRGPDDDPDFLRRL